MNERITLLAEQAGLIAGKHDDLDFKKNLTDKEKKFAELIVKKFDDILVLEHLDCVGNRDKQAEERIERLRERVKTYFGVEE
jgi:hypothetical protein